MALPRGAKCWQVRFEISAESVCLRRVRFAPLFVCAFWSALVTTGLVPLAGAQPLPPGNPGEGSYRVAVMTDSFPYSFVDEQGNVTGFSWELTREIERVMGLKFDWVVGTSPELRDKFRAGQVDLLPHWARFAEREAEIDFSVPYLTMSGALFVRSDERGIQSLEDMRGRRIAVVQGGLGETVLRRAGMEAGMVGAPNVEAALRKVAEGEADAAIAARLTGLVIIHRRELSKLRALDFEVPEHEVIYCFAVRKGERELLARMNEGLAILVQTGRFDEIYRGWFGALQPARFTPLQLASAIAAGLTVALAVALWVVVRLRRLQARIVRQADELRASEEWHRTVFDGAHEGLLVLEPEAGGRGFGLRQINRSGQRFLGLAGQPEPGTDLGGLLGADAGLAERLLTGARQEGLPEFEYERAGGAGWWRVAVTPLGRFSLVSLVDITESVRARLQLRQQEQRLMQSQKLEAIGTLAGGVAHDFNNVLTAIMGNAELAQFSVAPGSPEAENLHNIMLASRRAQQLVQQILAFSRRTEVSREPLVLTPIVRETTEFLRAVARGAIELRHESKGEMPPVLADAAQVHQALMNIGTNAVHAMRGQGGTISFVEEVVTLDATESAARNASLPPGTYVRIGVKDTGPGMSAEVVERIFEPFYTTKPPGEGTGLGLSVVHGIMQQHGGAVTVYSQLGRGSLFRLYFPVAAGGAVKPTTRPLAHRAGRGELVLLIDDEPPILRTIQQMLVQLGYRVLAFDQPVRALAEFEADPGRFAVVFTDLTMPGCHGLQVLERVRAVAPRKPVVLASGFFNEREEIEATQLGVHRLLHKPVSYGALGEALAVCFAGE